MWSRDLEIAKSPNNCDNLTDLRKNWEDSYWKAYGTGMTEQNFEEQLWVGKGRKYNSL